MNLLNYTLEGLQAQMEALGLPAWRAVQIFRAAHQQYVRSWDEIHTLPQALRARLAEEIPIIWPEIETRYQSSDGTVRYLLRLADGAQVEAVFLPEEIFDGDGKLVRQRATFCISTQVGCPVNCQFCLTATLGLKRNLEAGDIAAEALTLLREHGLKPGSGEADRVNLVYMGMGEPFLNYDHVMDSVRILTRKEGAHFSPRRITISTSGIIDKIEHFGREPVRPHLAISLNATTDEQRTRLMPLNRGQGGLQRLFEAARDFPLGAREQLTFEYVLLEGENDSLEDAARIVQLTRGLRAKVNLIAWNMGPELGFRTPSPERIHAFQQRLIAGGVPAFIRRPRGRDIYAACGQLKKAVVEEARMPAGAAPLVQIGG